jgi:hypothetical protein
VGEREAKWEREKESWRKKRDRDSKREREREREIIKWCTLIQMYNWPQIVLHPITNLHFTKSARKAAAQPQGESGFGRLGHIYS